MQKEFDPRMDYSSSNPNAMFGDMKSRRIATYQQLLIYTLFMSKKKIDFRNLRNTKI